MMPLWIRLLFFGTFIVLAAVTVLYLYRRLVRDLTARLGLRLAGAALLLGVAGGAVVARMVLRGSSAAQPLATVLGLWMGLLFYTLVTLLVVDVVRLSTRVHPRARAPVSPERRAFLARAVAAGSVVSGAGLAGWGVFRAYQPPRIQEVSVRLRGLPKSLEGFTIVQLSDLHVGPILQQAFVDDLVSRTNALKPDLVAMTGDLIDGKPSEIGGFVSRLTRLNSRLGTYFCSGNHDHYAGWEEWSRVLTGLGLNVLNNRRVTIGEPGASFDLIGVEDYGTRAGRGGGYDPEAALKGRDPARASVLLSHQPGGFDDAVRLGVGLQLAGHTHGGQTFPITAFATLLWHSRAAGLSQEGGSQLFVSRGCGFVGPPMRLGSPSEIIKVVLLPG